MSRPPTLAGALLVLLLLAVAAPAMAHTAATPEVLPAAAPLVPAAALPDASAISAALAAEPAWPWLLLLPAALLGVRRRPRRALGLALALVLAVFAFENALHSVHHLESDRQATGCALASASVHVAGALVDVVQVAGDAARSVRRLVEPEHVMPLLRPLRPDQGRAPPVHLA